MKVTKTTQSTIEANSIDFAYRFEECEDGLSVEIWHKDGELIKTEFISY